MGHTNANAHVHGCEDDAAQFSELRGLKLKLDLKLDQDALESLHDMEVTGGEPDVIVIGRNQEAGHFSFCDIKP